MRYTYFCEIFNEHGNLVRRTTHWLYLPASIGCSLSIEDQHYRVTEMEKVYGAEGRLTLFPDNTFESPHQTQ